MSCPLRPPAAPTIPPHSTSPKLTDLSQSLRMTVADLRGERLSDGFSRVLLVSALQPARGREGGPQGPRLCSLPRRARRAPPRRSLARPWRRGSCCSTPWRSSAATRTKAWPWRPPPPCFGCVFGAFGVWRPPFARAAFRVFFCRNEVSGPVELEEALSSALLLSDQRNNRFGGGGGGAEPKEEGPGRRNSAPWRPQSRARAEEHRVRDPRRPPALPLGDSDPAERRGSSRSSAEEVGDARLSPRIFFALEPSLEPRASLAAAAADAEAANEEGPEPEPRGFERTRKGRGSRRLPSARSASRSEERSAAQSSASRKMSFRKKPAALVAPGGRDSGLGLYSDRCKADALETSAAWKTYRTCRKCLRPLTAMQGVEKPTQEIDSSLALFGSAFRSFRWASFLRGGRATGVFCALTAAVKR